MVVCMSAEVCYGVSCSFYGVLWFYTGGIERLYRGVVVCYRASCSVRSDLLKVNLFAQAEFSD